MLKSMNSALLTFVLLCLVFGAQSFVVVPKAVSPRRPSLVSFVAMSMSSSEEDEGKEAKEGMTFDDATQAIKDAEDEERMQARGMALDEEAKNFESKKSSYEDMRSKIRARASDLNIEKSVATAEAIKQATARAQAGEAAAEPSLDLSKFGESVLENPEDELTDEQKKEIDKVGQLPLWEQVIDEVKNTKFPTPGATIKQAGLMLLIFAVTAGIILKVDELLRIQYTEWGFIPDSGSVPDYSDLTLPEGWTDQMNDADLANM